MITGTLELPKMTGKEVSPGVTLLGEPTTIPGTNKLQALANFHGALCLIELSIKIGADNVHP